MLSQPRGPTDGTKALLLLGSRCQMSPLVGPANTTGWVNPLLLSWSWQEKEISSTLGLVGTLGGNIPPLVFCWSRTEVLLSCPLFAWAFVQGELAFLNSLLFPLLCLVVVPVCRLHRPSTPDTGSNKETQGTGRHAVSQVWKSSVNLPSFHGVSRLCLLAVLWL